MQDTQVRKPMLSAEQAILQMLGEVAPLTQSVSVPLSDALDRVLAQPVLSSLNVPGYDNAAMESFWATLTTECFGSYVPETKEQAKIMIFDYIEGFYNLWRLHSALGYKSPLDYESPQSHKPD